MEGGQDRQGRELEGGSGEVGGGGDHVAVQSTCFQEVVDDAASAVVGDQQVRVGQVVVEGDRGPKRQEAGVEQAGVAGGEQVPGAVVGAVGGGGGHTEIDLTTVDHAGEGIPAGLTYGDPDARQRRGSGQQSRQKHRFHIVGHAQSEGPAGRGRIEVVPVDHGAVDQSEGRLDAPGQLDGTRCRLDTSAGAGEQLVVEQPAEPTECGAGRALAQMQGGCCPGDAALTHQGGEDDQKIEVGSPEFGFINVDHCEH